jgi:hypothetical protein
LTLSPEQAAKAVLVEVDGVVAGFHLLAPSSVGSDVGELDMLFVDPPVHRVGDRADPLRGRSALGCGSRVDPGADRGPTPQARPFYERLGAVQVGERLSRSVPGRSLPLFELTLRGGRQLAPHRSRDLLALTLGATAVGLPGPIPG